jgi:hypothetical protein
LQAHNPRIVTNGLIYHLDPTNGGKGGSKILAKPTQISDCILWLDADDAETVVTSGANITNWLDKSGKGNHAEDHGATEYPQYDSSRINGRRVVNFVATSNTAGDVLKGAFASGSQPFSGSGTTMITVIRQNSFVGTEYAAWFEAAQGAFASGSYGNRVIFNMFGSAYGSGGSADKVRMANDVGTTSWGKRIENNAAVMGVYTNDSSTTKTYFNGEFIGNHGEDKGDDARTYYCLGDDMTSDDHFNGYICEIIIYNKVLSDAERQSVEYYLSRKWAIPLKARPTTNLADGVSTVISNSSPAEITHNNTFYFPNPDDDNCDIRLEANEIAVADNLPWTVEFWIKRHARGNTGGGDGVHYDGVWGNSYTSSNYDRMQFGIGDEDKLWFGDSAGGGGEITNIADIDCLHKWRHVVLAFDGTTDPTTAGCIRQYVDGSDKGPAIALTTAPSDITVRRIGSRGHATDDNRLEGELGNFRVYNKQLSHAEVLQNYNAQRAKYENKKMSFAAPDNLVLYLDAQSGTSSNYYADGTWYDISGGTAYNGTKVNSPSFLDEGVKYYDFNGTNEYFDCGDVYAADQMTLCAWVKLNVVPASQTSNYPQLFGKRDVDTQRSYFFSFQKSNSKLYWEIKDAAGVYYTQHSTKTDWAADTWYYCVVTYTSDSGIAKMYIDGVEDAGTFSPSQPWSLDPIPDTAATCRIGGGGSYYLNGGIANTMFYDVTLSADQIVQNYNYFKHRFGK